MTAPRTNSQPDDRGRRQRRPPCAVAAPLGRSIDWIRVAAAAAASLALSFTAPAHAEMIVAVAVPLSGPHASEGRAIVQAVQWAITDVNARGGIAGEQVALVSEDDACDEIRATAAAGRIADRNPALVVGHPCGGPAQAAAKVYAAAGLLFIATAPRHPDLTRRRAGPSVFRLAGRDDLQSAATASYLATAYAGKRLAIVHDRTRYARTLVDGLKRARQPIDASPLPEFGIVASSKDYAATVAALRAHRAEVVYFAGFPSEAIALWRQFRPNDVIPDLVGSDALANAGAELSALSTGSRFATRILRPYTALDASGAKPLSDRLVAAGMATHASAIAANAAIELWSAAIAGSSAGDVAALAKRLQGEPIASALGPVSFDATGDADVPSFAVTVPDGERSTVDAIILRRGTTTEITKVVGVDPASGKGSGGGDVIVPGGTPTAAASDRAPPLPIRHPMRRTRP